VTPVTSSRADPAPYQRDLVQVAKVEEFERVRSRVKEIVDLGEILIPFGEFVENNHVLIPGSYSLEWYKVELRRQQAPYRGLAGPCRFRCRDGIVPRLRRRIASQIQSVLVRRPAERTRRAEGSDTRKGSWKDGRLIVRSPGGCKRTLETLGALHKADAGSVVLDRYAEPLIGAGHRGQRREDDRGNGTCLHEFH